MQDSSGPRGRRLPTGASRGWARPVLAAAVMSATIAIAPVARAEDATDEQAEQLEQQVRAWLAELAGPHVHLPDRPLEITAEDDHFRLRLPLDEIAAGSAVTMSGGPITALAKPLDGGRWAIDSFQIPSPFSVSYPLPNGGDTTMTYTLDEQTQHAVFDPSLATASTWDGTIKGYATRSEGPQGTQSTRMEELVNHQTWQPAEGGRLNVLAEFDGKLLTVNSVAPKVGLVSFSAEKLHGSAHMDELQPERLRPILRAVFDLLPVAMQQARETAADKPAKRKRLGDPAGKLKPAEAHHDAMKLPPEARDSVRAALVAMRDLTDGFGEKIAFDNLNIEAAGHGGHAARMEAGMGISAPDGLLTLRLNFALDGLDSPDIPAGVYRDYLPRHIALSPRIGGVVGNDLIDLLIASVDSNGHDPALQAQADELLNKGPITVGLDDLALDFGPVTLKGSGAMRIVSRTDYSGDARLTATGIDAMIKQAGTTPELQQAVPVLILLKGVSQPDGDKLVWNISYRDGKMLVNNTDLSQMIPGK